MKKLFCLLAIVVLTLSLSACSGGIDGDTAREHVNDFFGAVKEDDYEKAETFLHPERSKDIGEFFEKIEQEEEIDFSNIKSIKYTGFTSSFYDSSIDGSAYTLNAVLTVGSKQVEAEVEIVQNDKGFGIYNLDIDT